MKLLARLSMLLLTCAAIPASSCPISASASASASALQKAAVQAVWKVTQPPIAAGKFFAVEVQLCPAEAVLTRVDATMPEHQHGMNYRPSIKRVGDAKDGRWTAEGLMFHMPGRWELRLDVQLLGRAERITDTVMLP